MKIFDEEKIKTYRNLEELVSSNVLVGRRDGLLLGIDERTIDELRNYMYKANMYDKQKEVIDKLTAESTEWEERTYCWQDRAENLQIVLDKIKEKINEELKEGRPTEEGKPEEYLWLMGYYDACKDLNELLEEIE